MKFASVRELKNGASALLRTVSRGRDVLITSHGKPVAVLHGISEDELEDYVLGNHPELRRSLDEAESELKKRGGLSLEEVMARLEKKRVRA